MTRDADPELAALRQMTVAELRARFVELLGEPPRSRHKQHLVRRLAWRIQALREGDLSERARQRAAELARDADLRLGTPRRPKAKPVASYAAPPRAPDKRLPMPGTILVRPYAGQTLQVLVLEQGFEYEGQIYRSLTAVARQITGQHWNGFHFFGLNSKGAVA
jgi:hypothetical protein